MDKKKAKLKDHLKNPPRGDVQWWWYENQSSIDIYIGKKGSDALTCSIPRAQIAGWIKRTAKRKKKGK